MISSTGADSTRDRIVAAATAEFARHGIAGARIERIAKAAKTSKERVYAYFRGKEELYRFVSGRELAAIAEATRMDPADLPGYAGRIHDYFTAHPERHRLMAWGQLELDPDGTTDDDPIRQTMAHKTEQLRAAQEAGHLDPAWDPLDVLVLVNQIATSWANQPGLAAGIPPQERAAYLASRRTAVVAAVQRLFPSA
ncbi:TetR family transcriptional regulator [Streptomyces arenae]|uniref:TetR family transcriptional regulator n=1 Tax=Streptomyces arenae TaxID=29301 RepID=UPI00265908A7|nr:TetR family transcriptional regulator [Streptomyces arenae]MCG7207366.1 TetR family transcriptional regulator [Streptomyces arenae]